MTKFNLGDEVVIDRCICEKCNDAFREEFSGWVCHKEDIGMMARVSQVSRDLKAPYGLNFQRSGNMQYVRYHGTELRLANESLMEEMKPDPFFARK